MKVLLVLAAGSLLRRAVASGHPLRTYAPTTLLVLEALVPPELNAEVRTVDLGVDVLPETIDADLLAISAITSAAPEAYRIADRARSQGIAVVIGGYHATACPDEALGHADAVVVGFAERVWPAVLRDFAKGTMRRFYRDTVRKSRWVAPPLDRSLLRGKGYFITDTTEATRGCPNRCGFCVVPCFAERRQQRRAIESVVAEIETMGRRVVFLDPSLFENRNYVTALLRAIEPLGVRWYAAATLRLSEDDELLRLAARSGCRGVLVGFESIVQTSLDVIGKTFNRADHYGHAIENFHRHGISVLGSFAFGFDHDDATVFEETAKFVIESQVDLAKLGILTPLPGTALHAQLDREDRLLTRDWELYDTEHCVFQPARMSPDTLEAGLQSAHEAIYSYAAIGRRLARFTPGVAKLLAANVAVRRFRRIGG